MKRLLYLCICVPLFSVGQSFLPKSDGEIVKHSYYTLAYNEQHEQAAWVLYKLDGFSHRNKFQRKNDFRKDPFVSTGSASLTDYKGSGYDRGHLAPAADMKQNRQALSASFYLSNISPQLPSFNRGAWKKLETLVRRWSETSAPLYVVTAGVLESDLQTIGVNGVSVPKQFYKIVYAPKEEKMFAFLMPNQKITAPLPSFVVSVDSLEVLTGIDFFPQLEDGAEALLEQQCEFNLWGL